jgi:hypothetical protein
VLEKGYGFLARLLALHYCPQEAAVLVMVGFSLQTAEAVDNVGKTATVEAVILAQASHTAVARSWGEVFLKQKELSFHSKPSTQLTLANVPKHTL